MWVKLWNKEVENNGKLVIRMLKKHIFVNGCFRKCCVWFSICKQLTLNIKENILVMLNGASENIHNTIKVIRFSNFEQYNHRLTNK